MDPPQPRPSTPPAISTRGSDLITEESEEFGETAFFLRAIERDAGTPPRVQSAHSLFGEGLLRTGRPDEMVSPDEDNMMSPDDRQLSPSEATTPPSTIHNVMSLSPPPLQPNISNSTSQFPQRPPRGPSTRSVGPGGPSRRPVNHKRNLSAGDASLLSALTDASYEQPVVVVSEGDVGIQQPLLFDDDPPELNGSTILDDTYSADDDNEQVNRSPLQRLQSLEDIAEALILEAIEDQQRVVTDVESILDEEEVKLEEAPEDVPTEPAVDLVDSSVNYLALQRILSEQHVTVDDGNRHIRHTSGDAFYANANALVDAVRTSEPLPTNRSETSSPRDDLERGPGMYGRVHDKVTHVTGDVAGALRDGVKRAKADFQIFSDFIEPQRPTLFRRARAMLLFLILPATFVAFILFYVSDNPPTGRLVDGKPREGQVPGQPSASWLILFLCVRQPIMYGLAMLTEFIIINWALVSPRLVRLVGPTIGLFITSSQGWPCTLFFFASYDFMFLYGKDRFSAHWLYWQDMLRIFNADNPAGDSTSRDMYRRLLIVLIVNGAAAAVKRVWTGFHIGQRLYSRYNASISDLMESLVTIVRLSASAAGRGIVEPGIFDSNGGISSEGPDSSAVNSTLDDSRIKTSRDRGMIFDLLEAWQEPHSAAAEKDAYREVQTKDILSFRQSYALIKTMHPFSKAFGPSNTREACVESAQRLYRRLLKLQKDPDATTLQFETLVDLVATSEDPSRRSRSRRLRRMFKPDKDGNLSHLDFIRAIDAVYRELRFLVATIENFMQVDRAYERILNSVYFLFMLCVSLAILQIDALAFIVSLSSIAVAFAFMIGAASSNYFEGLLLILVRKPYEIGDRIAVSNVESAAETTGSAGWVVEKVDLFSTTLRLAATGEVATVSNGSLARSRIINMQRSQRAQVSLVFKFGVEVPLQKIEIFRKSVYSFVKQRPQEWRYVVSFRNTRVEVGEVEYVLVLEHIDSWQKFLTVSESRSHVANFCLELQKKLDMRYVAPALPVHLQVAQESAESKALLSLLELKKTN